jgi:hypothetical protein
MSITSKKYTGWVIFLLSVGSLIFFVIYFNLKTCWGNPLFSPATLGQFGDFYGGIIATIAAIVAGVFLYQTYEIAKKDSDFQNINKLFDNIVNDINGIQFRTKYDKDWKELPPNQQTLYTGVDAIYNFDSLSHTNPNSVLNHLSFIINSFENIIYLANKVLYKYDDMKEITMRRIYYLYYSHILWSVWELEFPNQKKINAVPNLLTSLSKQNLHDDSKFTVDKYAKLSIETIAFLSDDKRNLIAKKPSEIEKLEKLKMVTPKS